MRHVPPVCHARQKRALAHPEAIGAFIGREDRTLSTDLLKRMRADGCAAVDIQIIVRKAHPPTGLNGRVRFQNEAVRESPSLSNHLGFPRTQSLSLEPQDRPHPRRRQINRGPYQEVLRGPEQQRQNGRGAHGPKKLEHNVRRFQSVRDRMKQHFELGSRCRWAGGAVKARGQNSLGIGSDRALRKRAAAHKSDRLGESRMRPCPEPSSAARDRWRNTLHLMVWCLRRSRAFAERALS